MLRVGSPQQPNGYRKSALISFWALLLCILANRKRERKEFTQSVPLCEYFDVSLILFLFELNIILPCPHTRPPWLLIFIPRRVLKSLFPSWLPAQFAVMFSKPFPAFSSRLNAWVTVIASQWLMGPSQLNDIEVKSRIHMGICAKGLGWSNNPHVHPSS